jgi:hypothetical protein
MNIQLVQALIVITGLLLQMGLVYILLRKVWRKSRREAGLIATGQMLLFCVAAWLCGWGSEMRWSVLFWALGLDLCWSWGVSKWFRRSRGELPVQDIADRFGVARATLYRNAAMPELPKVLKTHARENAPASEI